MAIIFGIIVIVIGFFMIKTSRKYSKRIEKAKFERRNTSGVEIFSSWEEAEKAKRAEKKMKLMAGILFGPGIIVTAYGIFVFVLGFISLFITK